MRRVLFSTEIDEKGRYVVRLPFKQGVSESIGNLGDLYSTAVRIFHRMENRFDSDLKFAKLYKYFMKDYIDCGHMTQIKVES